MKLAAHSDASYLSKPKARSRAGGHVFLSSKLTVPTNNGAVLNIAHIIKHVLSFATEAKLAALYIIAREAVYIRIVLEELGHKQPPTPLQKDNPSQPSFSCTSPWHRFFRTTMTNAASHRPATRHPDLAEVLAPDAHVPGVGGRTRWGPDIWSVCRVPTAQQST